MTAVAWLAGLFLGMVFMAAVCLLIAIERIEKGRTEAAWFEDADDYLGYRHEPLAIGPVQIPRREI